ncbi:MAG TPA: hypothetical protein PKL74_09975 [Tenuifilaceae bacterium]|nr:hypothetical protein [Tenuifilaceae bacterium]
MKVCGFTFVRNAIKFECPLVESINSVLPLCDSILVVVGNSDDDRLELVKSINSPKIRIIETVWDDSLKGGGRVLAVETNKAFDAISSEFDWCFYIQADEVVHEKDYPAITDAMRKWKDNPKVEGLLFKYFHFWGTYNYIGVNRQWYRHEIRIIRNDKKIRSFRDAQGFRRNDNKLRVKTIDAHIYHYGWVRPPAVMVAKQRNLASLYLDTNSLKRMEERLDVFSYNEVDAVKRFGGTHPACMQRLTENISWNVSIDEKRVRMKFKDKVLYIFERIFGYRLFEYKNYIKV